MRANGRGLEESDTYLMILEQGEERGEVKARRGDILLVGEARLGAASAGARDQLGSVNDLDRLIRMVQKAATAATWQEILETQ